MVAGGQKVAKVATFGMVGGQNKKNDGNGGKQSSKAPTVLLAQLTLASQLHSQMMKVSCLPGFIQVKLMNCKH